MKNYTQKIDFMIRHVFRSFAHFNSTMNHLNWINLMISFIIKKLDRYQQHAISSSIDDLTILLISQQNLLWSRISIIKWWNSELTQRNKKRDFVYIIKSISRKQILNWINLINISNLRLRKNVFFLFDCFRIIILIVINSIASTFWNQLSLTIDFSTNTITSW